jgi:hypothetical protein
MRQSAGNNVANRLSAMPFTDETKDATTELSRSKFLVPLVRVGCPVLLKTILPRLSDSGPSRQTNCLQYTGLATCESMRITLRQRRDG